MKLFQKYRDKKAAKNQARKARLEQSKKDAEFELSVATAEMLSSPCAVSGFKLCQHECVHWKRGHINYFPSFYDEPPGGFFYAVRPTCRLWGER